MLDGRDDDDKRSFNHLDGAELDAVFGGEATDRDVRRWSLERVDKVQEVVVANERRRRRHHVIVTTISYVCLGVSLNVPCLSTICHHINSAV